MLDCLALVTFVGANDLDETEVALSAMWEVIHPKSGSNVCESLIFRTSLYFFVYLAIKVSDHSFFSFQVGTVKKYRPPVVAAAITAWSFLLTTISTWRSNPENWKE